MLLEFLLRDRVDELLDLFDAELLGLRLWLGLRHDDHRLGNNFRDGFRGWWDGLGGWLILFKQPGL